MLRADTEPFERRRNVLAPAAQMRNVAQKPAPLVPEEGDVAIHNPQLAQVGPHERDFGRRQARIRSQREGGRVERWCDREVRDLRPREPIENRGG